MPELNSYPPDRLVSSLAYILSPNTFFVSFPNSRYFHTVISKLTSQQNDISGLSTAPSHQLPLRTSER